MYRVESEWSFKQTIFLIISVLFFFIYTDLVEDKPDDVDFINWIENTYDVDCTNIKCDRFKYDVIKDGQKKTIIMYANKDNYSSRLFVMEREMNFFNYDDDSYQLYIKVKGFNGNIRVLEEVNTLGKY